LRIVVLVDDPVAGRVIGPRVDPEGVMPKWYRTGREGGRPSLI
jgi:hypothetical protein